MPDTKPKRRLLTHDEVVAALRSERNKLGLMETAKRYNVSAQQICDVLADRKRLSKRMVKRLSYITHTFYEKTEFGDVTE